MRIVSLKSFYQPSHLILMLATLTILGSNFDGKVTQAQELRKAVRDYRDDRVFDYRASDPEHRGKVFNVHTGHYGKFYNCDGEEAKRNSPYICWKPHHENDFPTCLGFCENLRRDIVEIKQRISDGGCGSSCDCNECQPNQCRQPVRTNLTVQPSSCSCPQCVVTASKSSNSIASSTKSNPGVTKSHLTTSDSCDCATCKLSSNAKNGPSYRSPRSATSSGTTLRSTELQNRSKQSYGLVSGKIFRPTTVPQRPAVARADFDQADQSVQTEMAPRLPLEEVVQTESDLPSRGQANSSLITTLRNKARSSSAPKVQPPRYQGPRVVERTDFWNPLKVF